MDMELLLAFRDNKRVGLWDKDMTAEKPHNNSFFVFQYKECHFLLESDTNRGVHERTAFKPSPTYAILGVDNYKVRKNNSQCYDGVSY